MIQEDSFVSSFLVSFNLCQDIVQVVQGLYIRGYGIRCISSDTDTDGFEPDFIQVTVHGSPTLGYDNHAGFPTIAGVKPEISSASRNNRTDICIFKVIFPEG